MFSGFHRLDTYLRGLQACKPTSLCAARLDTGLQEIPIQRVLLHPNTTSCPPGSDIVSCAHNLHIASEHRASHCFDNQLDTTCKTASLEKKVAAISTGFQCEADVKSVTIYNWQNGLFLPMLPSFPEPIKVVS